MKNTDQLNGALGEINRQIVHLNKRKNELLALADADAGDDAVTNDSARAKAAPAIMPAPSYAAYIHAFEQRREPLLNPHVVFHGEHGSFTEQAAVRFFGENAALKGMRQFEQSFLALKNGEADYAVLPIENSSTGAIRQVYDLLAKYNCFLAGETTVVISHSLLVLPGTRLEDIRCVYSHEQGLFQCEPFLHDHPDWKTIPQPDTAGSAKLVASLGDPSCAAIGSACAADLYGLEVLKENINHNARNTTRFVIVSPQLELRQNRDKICISLTTQHESGSLHDILTVFAVHGINLVRLESRPIIGRNWEYMFFIEFTGDLTEPGMDDVIHEIALLSGDLRVLGNFKSNL